jgi:hypothetical protein
MSVKKITHKGKRMKPLKGDSHSEYSRMWRLVDGVVRDTFATHPEYLTEMGRHSARISLTKRLVGVLASRQGKGRTR